MPTFPEHRLKDNSHQNEHSKESLANMDFKNQLNIKSSSKPRNSLSNQILVNVSKSSSKSDRTSKSPKRSRTRSLNNSLVNLNKKFPENDER